MTRTIRKRRGWTLGVTLAALVGGVAGVSAWLGFRREEVEPPPMVRVERADLELSLVVGGEIEGGKSTIVECELENLPGPDGRPGAGMTLIELIPDGTPVRKGDVLCRFDSSVYEELARRQKIEVERATSEERQAELELEATRAALVAYRDGESVQLAEGLESKIALAQAELRKAEERLEWSERMFRVGYISSDGVAQARRARDQQEVDIANNRRALSTLTRYTAPKTVRELEVRVEDAARRREFGTERRKLEEDRLEKFETLVENCTVKAPHDGLAIHANIFYRSRRSNSGDTFLHTGALILEGQPLFILPDLAHPIVQLVLHESIAPQVRKGMSARIRVPALRGRELTGQVEWINPVPTEQWRAYHEYQGFDARITINDPPPKLLPSLTAEVTILTEKREGALVVPRSAVAVENGQTVCYLPGTDGFERRMVQMVPADRDRVEIVKGLDEGDLIVLDPSPFRARPEGLLDPLPASVRPTPAATADRGAAPAETRPT